MMAMHQGWTRRRLDLGQSTGRDKQLLQAIFVTCIHILYLRHEGAIVVTPHMSLPISTINAAELFKIPTLFNDII